MWASYELIARLKPTTAASQPARGPHVAGKALPLIFFLRSLRLGWIRANCFARLNPDTAGARHSLLLIYFGALPPAWIHTRELLREAEAAASGDRSEGRAELFPHGRDVVLDVMHTWGEGLRSEGGLMPS